MKSNRCMQTEDMRPGSTCFQVIKAKKLAFEGITENRRMLPLRPPLRNILLSTTTAR